MQEKEICERPEQAEQTEQTEQTGEWHARWLAMQSAYAEYRRSSEALECTRLADDDSVQEDRLRLLERRQRIALERYLDARIGFLESRIDEVTRPDKISADSLSEQVGRQTDSRLKAFLSPASSRAVLQTLVVIALCALTFSMVRVQTSIRDLVSARDELRGAILQVSREMQMQREKLDSRHAQSSGPTQVEHTPTATVKPAAPQSRVRKPVEGNPTQQHASRPTANANRTSPPGGPGRNTAGRSILTFSLVPTGQFQRVGPVSVLLRSVDAQKGTASLYIVTEAAHVDLYQLRLAQPVWFKASNREQYLALVADRITNDRIDGRLVEAGAGKPDVRAAPFSSIGSRL